MYITLPYSSKVGQSIQRTIKCDRHASAWSSCSKGRRCIECESFSACRSEATIHELANNAELAPLTVLNILKKRQGMQKIASRWISCDLTENQKWLQYDAARTQLECESEAFLWWIITVDETWARAYEPQLKHQSNEWNRHGSPQKVP